MRHRIWTGILLSGVLLLLTACADKKSEEPQILPVTDTEEEAYAVTTAEYGDVIANLNVPCKYVSTQEQEFSFPTDGRRIANVNVKQGDYVLEGQILASLEVQDLEERIVQQEYEVKHLELEVAQMKELFAFDLDSAQTLFYYTKQSAQDKKELNRKQEELRERYRPVIADLEDSLTVKNAYLQQYRRELEEGRLVSEISGQVTFCKKNLPDTYSKKDEVLFVVSDREACFFYTEEIEEKNEFTSGKPITVSYRDSQGEHQYGVFPAGQEAWENGMYFQLDTEEIPEIGTDGKLNVELGRKEHVLCVLAEAVHQSDKGEFVYLVRDGVLEMRYVTVGLKGDVLAEIVDGLEAGDMIALKR